MRIPTVRGVIDRRILVNYRVDAECLKTVLPEPFRPQIVAGYAMAGICLIRLRNLRPRWLPSMLGIGSENAAHRMAVDWEADGKTHSGVYVPRRDTSSLLNVIAGGRIFPGKHSLASFTSSEQQDRYRLDMRSRDGETRVSISGRTACSLPENSVFESVAAASKFFECGSLGYSPSTCENNFDGLELRSFNWQVQPLAVESVTSSFFEDEQRFPAGTVEFDHALLMRDIDHQWLSRESISNDSILQNRSVRNGGAGKPSALYRLPSVQPDQL